jgi:hypothetical protein
MSYMIQNNIKQYYEFSNTHTIIRIIVDTTMSYVITSTPNNCILSKLIHTDVKLTFISKFKIYK